MKHLKKLGLFFILTAGAPIFSDETPSEEVTANVPQAEETVVSEPENKNGANETMEQFPIISDQETSSETEAE